MTNCNHAGLPSAYSQAFRQVFAKYGVTDTQGVELLRLVHLVTNTYEQVATASADDSKLSPPRWRLLVRLLLEEEMGGSHVYPTELSRAQSVSKNTISAHLRSLEEQGLILRELDPDDHRQFRIKLSDAGRTLVQNATPRYMAFLNELISDLLPGEIEQLQFLLSKLRTSLVRHGRLDTLCEAHAMPSSE